MDVLDLGISRTVPQLRISGKSLRAGLRNWTTIYLVRLRDIASIDCDHSIQHG